jgi:hypothetical protein
MKRMHKWIVGGITFTVAMSLVTASTFAAKALTDEEMDQATAKGQSTVSKGNGNQTINDNAKANVSLIDQAQQNAVAGDLINVAGENNVAAVVNAASSGGGAIDSIEQENNVVQNKAAVIDQSTLDIENLEMDGKGTSSKSRTEDCTVTAGGSSTRSKTANNSLDVDATLDITKSSTYTSTESFPENVTITGTINSDATSTANGDATSTADAASTTTSTATASSTTETDVNRTEDLTKDITVDVTKGDSLDSVGNVASVGGPGEQGRGERDGVGAVDATVEKKHLELDAEFTGTEIEANGDAAIAQADAEGHEQAYAVSAAEGQAKAESDADLSIDLPTAKSRTSTRDSSVAGTVKVVATRDENCSSSSESTFSSSRSKTETCDSTSEFSMTSSKDKSQLERVTADHVKIGDGEQVITDETEYEVSLSDDAQGAATALSIINVAGRNNVATAWNLASSAGGAISVVPYISSGSLSTPGSIHQLNVVNQVN